MRHPFMEGVAQRLFQEWVATYRYEFPYMAQGKRRPDRPNVLVPAVRDAVAAAASLAPDLPLFAGGKSMGGRMTSTAAAESPGLSDPAPVGLVFLGFPLHPAGRPGTNRAAHLGAVPYPTLFLQGDRDKLAGLDLLRPVLEELPHATLHVVDGADHGFHVLKRSGRTDGEVLDELARTTASWMRERLAGVRR